MQIYNIQKRFASVWTKRRQNLKKKAKKRRFFSHFSRFHNFSLRNFSLCFSPIISLSLFIARAARDWLFLGFSSEDGHVMGRFKTRL